MTIREFSAFTTMSSLSIGASAFETGRVHVELHRLTAHRSLGRVGGSFHTVAISESCPVVGPFRYGSQGSKRRGPLVRAVQTAGPSSARSSDSAVRRIWQVPGRRSQLGNRAGLLNADGAAFRRAAWRA
jgi:hypothetical protein